MLETKEMEDYLEIKNNLHEERINESDECRAIFKYVLDAGLFLEEEVTDVLNELDYKKEDLDNWLMLRIVLERLKMEYMVSTIEEYLEQFKEGMDIPNKLNSHIDNASILFEEIQGGQVVLFRKGHTVSVLQIFYPYQ